jgi:hypothetical protein
VPRQKAQTVDASTTWVLTLRRFVEAVDFGSGSDI